MAIGELISLFAPALSMVMGTFLSFCIAPSHQALSLVQYFAAGVIFAAAGAELVPKVLRVHPPTPAGEIPAPAWQQTLVVCVSFLVGISAMLAIKELCKPEEGEQEKEKPPQRPASQVGEPTSAETPSVLPLERTRSEPSLALVTPAARVIKVERRKSYLKNAIEAWELCKSCQHQGYCALAAERLKQRQKAKARAVRGDLKENLLGQEDDTEGDVEDGETPHAQYAPGKGPNCPPGGCATCPNYKPVVPRIKEEAIPHSLDHLSAQQHYAHPHLDVAVDVLGRPSRALSVPHSDLMEEEDLPSPDIDRTTSVPHNGRGQSVTARLVDSKLDSINTPTDGVTIDAQHSPPAKARAVMKNKTAPIEEEEAAVSSTSPIGGSFIGLAKALPWSFVCAVCADAMADGLAIGVVLATSASTAAVIAIGTSLEMMFVAFTFCLTLQPYGRSRALVTSALPPILLALTTYLVAKSVQTIESMGHGLVYTGLSSFGLAALLFLATDELLQEAYENQSADISLASVLFYLGFLLVILGENLTKQISPVD
ncbi:unnamed protein product [Vitrella brassicaformis CCMP3155]|uniref:Uncharacterized protein n=3 Tax=Vitrella brassicaformis TaxID=1169539 RepID=A0A0G4EVN4_VITBC|nr:unnamed protein product [Vitrella brassicaformis CCMP3155]|eukprot:CEM02482.1 unnamed protein product [Vitrella brassicaformis CCMP3155]